MEKSMKRDLQDFAALIFCVVLIIFLTLLFAAVSQYVAGVAWRAGLVSAPAQWTIYCVSFLACIGVILSLLGRVLDGRWWWK
jgi:hypothetical protein